MKRSLCAWLSGIALMFVALNAAVADPLPGRDILKFSQLPMVNTTLPAPGTPTGVAVYHGHDELSTAYSIRPATGGDIIGYEGTFMADDFADGFNSPVLHVQWWGSYLNRPTFIPDATIKRFLISFEEDIPADPNVPTGFSRPGKPLLNQIVSFDTDGVLTPHSGTFTEQQISPPFAPDGPIFQYNAELHLGKEFRQEPDKVYWLKIVALVDRFQNLPNDQQVQWGWHNRDYTIFDPLASTPPLVNPGEHKDGVLLTPSGGEIPIWHFQDDAVEGHVDVRFTADPMSRIMPEVSQDVFGPRHYLPNIDGPSIIGQHSKDLAFRLYTPEPSSCLLALLGLVGLGYGRRPRG